MKLLSRGIALVSVLLVVAMISSLALLSIARQRLWIRQLENRQTISQAQFAVYAGINFARLILRDDKNEFDEINEPWADVIPPVDIEEGKLSGCLIDMQGRYNLMNLVSELGTIDDKNVRNLDRLIKHVSIPHDTARKIAETLAQYRSESKEVGGDTLTPEELVASADITQEDWDKIKPFVTLLPKRTSININFAKPEVLIAVIPDLSLSEAESIAMQRKSHHFTSVEEFCATLPEKRQKDCANQTLSVKTRYFMAKVETQFGQVHRRYEALLWREQNNKMPRVLWGRQAQPGILNDCLR